MTRVILASASSGRRKVLRGAGIDPLVMVSGVDEDAVMSALPVDSGPGEATTALAVAKARAVVQTIDDDLGADCLVVGCDSMLYRDGRLWGKPVSEAAVIENWRSMAGTSGELYTGHCLIRLRDNQIHTEVAEYAKTSVRFGHPSETELAAYARSGEPTAVAGGFTLDGLGGWFIEGIEGDPSNVIGISLPLTHRLIARSGLGISTLWQDNSPLG